VSKKKLIIIILLIAFILIAGGLTWYIFNGGNGNDNSATSSTKTEKPAAASSKDMASYISGVSNLSKFNKLLNFTGESEVLKSTASGYIVLAPNDDAFKMLPTGYYDSLFTADKKASATDITKYHVIIATTDQITNGQKLKTSEGQEVVVAIKDGSYYFTSAKGDQAQATKTQKTSNGTLYIIDKVLLPQ
jgi:uncharacterized surface protein with fasciclin (FAS1) repeats